MLHVLAADTDLAVTWEREQGRCVVLRLQGELELCTAHQLRREGERVASAGASRVILDLSRISFIDSAGMGAIVGLYKRARGRKDLCLVLQQGECRRLLDRLQLTRVLPTYGSVQDAIADVA